MPFSINYYLKYIKDKPPIEAPIYLRVIYRKKYYLMSMRETVRIDKWDQSKERLKGSAENAVKLNLYFYEQKRRVKNRMLELDVEYPVIPPQLIKNALKDQNDEASFSELFKRQLETLESSNRIGNYKKYNTVFRKLNNYLNDKELLFIEIDTDFLDNFSNFLRKKYKNGQNTIHNNLRVLRTVFYLGTDRGYKVQNPDLFKKYKLKKGKSKEIVFLEEDEVNRLWNLDLSADLFLEICRDMFVFSCDVGGMRISDVLLLKTSKIRNGRIIYTSRKTDITTTIKLSSRSQIIMKKYRGDNFRVTDYIFPILRGIDISEPKIEHSVLNSKTAIINKNLKEVSKRSRLDKEISFHVARHTFAMRALEIGIQLPHISKLMGHSNILMTEKYLSIQNNDLDMAMDKFN